MAEQQSYRREKIDKTRGVRGRRGRKGARQYDVNFGGDTLGDADKGSDGGIQDRNRFVLFRSIPQTSLVFICRNGAVQRHYAAVTVPYNDYSKIDQVRSDQA